MGKKADRIAELEAEVARLKTELAVARATAHTIVTAPCTRPHSDEVGPWVSPPAVNPFNPNTPYRIWC